MRTHRPVPAGRLSHTTLLTNLANHLQPLIRFDIGDRIVLRRRALPLRVVAAGDSGRRGAATTCSSWRDATARR